VRQCREASTPVFVKQLGADPRWAGADSVPPVPARGKNDDPNTWPTALRVREFPEGMRRWQQ
jgi:hypothetical protein